MIDTLSGVIEHVLRCRSVQEDRAALIDTAQSKIDTELFNVRWESKAAMNGDEGTSYGAVSGAKDLDDRIREEMLLPEQACVVMLKGFQTFVRGRLGIMPPSLAEWLKEHGYAREMTEEEMEEANREDVPTPDPADKRVRLTVAARVHICPSKPSASVSARTAISGGLEPSSSSLSSTQRRWSWTKKQRR